MIFSIMLAIFALSGLLIVGAVKFINLDCWGSANKYEVRRILRSNKLWGKFQEKELYCAICKKEITFQTLGAIYENNQTSQNRLVVLCRNPRCLREYLWDKEQKEIAQIHSIDSITKLK